MNALENVTRIEYEHLKTIRAHIILDAMLSLVMKGVSLKDLGRCKLEYLPEAREVVLFKPKETKLRYVKPEMVQVETPSATEEEVLIIAQRCLEQYRARTYR